MLHKDLARISVLALFVLTFLGTPLTVHAGGVCGGTYIVEQGQTVDMIAATCGTTVAAIYAANPGLGSSVYAGQSIFVPGNNYTAPYPTAYPTPYMPPPTPDYSNNSYYNPNLYYNSYNYAPLNYNGIYLVQYGDTFSGIAARFGVSVYDLQLANPYIWNINLLYVGQPIRVPTTSSNYGSVIYPTPTPTDPTTLTYSEAPSGSPKGKIKFVTKTNEDIYISLQGTTPDGYTVINEYSINGSMSVNVTAGYYEYLAMVGGQKYYGNFNLVHNGERTITFYKDKVTDSE